METRHPVYHFKKRRFVVLKATFPYSYVCNGNAKEKYHQDPIA